MNNIHMVEETLNRIQSYDGVIGVIVVNNDGISIRSTLDNSATVQYTSLVQQLIGTSKKIKKHDTSDDFMFLNLHTRKYEILIISEKQFIMIVVQNPKNIRSIK